MGFGIAVLGQQCIELIVSMLKKYARNHGSSTPFYIQKMLHFADLFTVVQVEKNMKNFQISMKKYRSQIHKIWNEDIDHTDEELLQSMPANFKKVYVELMKVKYKSKISKKLLKTFHAFNKQAQIVAIKNFLNQMDDNALIEDDNDRLIADQEIMEEEQESPFNLDQMEKVTGDKMMKQLYKVMQQNPAMSNITNDPNFRNNDISDNTDDDADEN